MNFWQRRITGIAALLLMGGVAGAALSNGNSGPPLNALNTSTALDTQKSILMEFLEHGTVIDAPVVSFATSMADNIVRQNTVFQDGSTVLSKTNQLIEQNLLVPLIQKFMSDGTMDANEYQEYIRNFVHADVAAQLTQEYGDTYAHAREFSMAVSQAIANDPELLAAIQIIQNPNSVSDLLISSISEATGGLNENWPQARQTVIAFSQSPVLMALGTDSMIALLGPMYHNGTYGQWTAFMNANIGSDFLLQVPHPTEPGSRVNLPVESKPVTGVEYFNNAAQFLQSSSAAAENIEDLVIREGVYRDIANAGLVAFEQGHGTEIFTSFITQAGGLSKVAALDSYFNGDNSPRRDSSYALSYEGERELASHELAALELLANNHTDHQQDFVHYYDLMVMKESLQVINGLYPALISDQGLNAAQQEQWDNALENGARASNLLYAMLGGNPALVERMGVDLEGLRQTNSALNELVGVRNVQEARVATQNLIAAAQNETLSATQQMTPPGVVGGGG